MTLPSWVPSTLGSLLSFGFGVADSWMYHAFDKTIDLLFIASGLGVLGVHVAYQWGKATPPEA